MLKITKSSHATEVMRNCGHKEHDSHSANFKLMDDNASASHISCEKPSVGKLEFKPSQSPDINPIEPSGDELGMRLNNLQHTETSLQNSEKR